jgi:hypothetical protein
MYDPVTNEWTTVGQIPEEYLTSDNGAFTNADETKVYVVGGYPLTYFNPDALAITFSFDVEAAVAAVAAEQGSAGDLVITRHADLNTQRGDIHAVTSTDGKKAYVAGGASSYPCEPLSVRIKVYAVVAFVEGKKKMYFEVYSIMEYKKKLL